MEPVSLNVSVKIIFFNNSLSAKRVVKNSHLISFAQALDLLLLYFLVKMKPWESFYLDDQPNFFEIIFFYILVFLSLAYMYREINVILLMAFFHFFFVL
jgi:hypothetical protein